MDKVRVYYDREGNTLSVWFDDPKKEHVCEEADDDMVLVKDRRGRVIGFERLNYLPANKRKHPPGGGVFGGVCSRNPAPAADTAALRHALADAISGEVRF